MTESLGVPRSFTVVHGFREERFGMAGGMVEDERLVDLRSEREGNDERYLTARLVASGDLWIEGQDLGPRTAIVSADGEYEWVWVVPAEELGRLLSVLAAPPNADVLEELEAHSAGGAAYEFERLLSESGLAKLHVL